MFSAVCLGGHWKRVGTVLPGALQVKGAWNTVSLDNKAFHKNRYDVVTRWIQRTLVFRSSAVAHSLSSTRYNATSSQ